VGGDVLISAGVTLLAVVLGAALSLLSQSRAAAREGAQQWRETRAAAYGRFLAAAGRCAAAADRSASVDEVAAVLGEVQLLARYDATAEQAEALFQAVRRLAAAPADEEAVTAFRAVQRGFIAAARHELRAGERVRGRR
jgi:hypothetical protein